MKYFVFLISSCSSIVSNFSTTTPTLNYSSLDKLQSYVGCQSYKGANEFSCVEDNMDNNPKKTSTSKTFKLVTLSPDQYIFTTDNKSSIFQVNKNQVILNERTLEKNSSTSRICVGTVMDKK